MYLKHPFFTLPIEEEAMLCSKLTIDELNTYRVLGGSRQRQSADLALFLREDNGAMKRKFELLHRWTSNNEQLTDLFPHASMIFSETLRKSIQSPVSEFQYRLLGLMFFAAQNTANARNIFVENAALFSDLIDAITLKLSDPNPDVRLQALSYVNALSSKANELQITKLIEAIIPKLKDPGQVLSYT